MYMLLGYANGMFSVRGSTQSKQFAPRMAKVTSKSSNALRMTVHRKRIRHFREHRKIGEGQATMRTRQKLFRVYSNNQVSVTFY